MNIFLIGMPGSGKSTTGKKLATKLSLEFIDLDKFIEKKFKKTVQQIFSDEGESFFREKEKECLTQIINSQKNYLLSLGGGTPCFFDNMKKIKENGISVYLELSAEAIVSRLKQGKNKRPMFDGLNEGELLEKVKSLLNEREKFYSQADLIVSGLNPDVNEIGELIKKYIS